MLEAKASDERGPECVDKVWDEQVDGAWDPGKAPVSLLTTFLKCIQDRNSVEAKRAARENGLVVVLVVEPNNRLVQDLLDAMKQHDATEAAAEEGSSDEAEEEDGESADREGDEEDDEEEEKDDDDGNEETGTKESDADAKNVGGE